MIEKKYRDFALEAEDPVVVFRGPSWEEVSWGPVQFPSLSRTLDGHIYCSWSVGNDSMEEYEGPGGKESPLPSDAVSEDGGRTWRRTNPADKVGGVPCANGKEYLGPAAKNAYTAPWTGEISPVFRAGFMSIFRSEDVPGFSPSYPSREIDPVTGEVGEFISRVNWPHCGVTVYPYEGRDLINPLRTTMGLMGQTIPDGEGGLFFATYAKGFSAVTGELVMPEKFNIYVFHSSDCGRTWDWISEVMTTPDLYSEEYSYAEGLCEPGIARMPDGSYVMLLRMGAMCPSRLVRSIDGCRSWSKPVHFDTCGVMPRICALGCGVTLAGYGRPAVFLRATSDPAGLAWEDPIDVGIRWTELLDGSCCYTSLLPLDDCSALFAYSDFRHPGPDGSLAKAIVVRRVTVRR